MVLFANVVIGQRVEVKYKGRIHRGTVKFKGSLNSVEGDWVGVALAEPVGKHNGLYRGTQYFSCKDGHGLFIHPSRIRFLTTKRCLFDNYHSVMPISFIEDTLFERSETPHVRSYTDPVSISSSYLDTARDLFRSEEQNMFSSTPRTYRLGHSVGREIRAATMRPSTSMSTYTYRSTPVHGFYDMDYNDEFISRPSMPMIHMPHHVLVRQNKRGWNDSVTKPREWSL
ncbi:uncharacterized protein LOC100367797 [Saccoglossus kowalevskii]|uniref:CAP-Gly domain-containing linker protein 4-like isoform X1 n=1 Tax=Saccoglossus kowalevskii TaxID=10224 RepID=A0ABM0N0T3_SACKO|nr:PREDICTED: CAP-Gly domain-containing linker protein 4-like isoform X1 [Saccoglossus kowalevskii]XP_006825875.1 PREDICTED: CAP-Gly domain-containing linker protein 4-like isoform X2 [Saccoglossus kowalevskii]